MQDLEPLTEKERKKFRELLTSDSALDQMLERAVRGRRKAGRRTRRSTGTT